MKTRQMSPLLMLTVAACASSSASDYPSLARRPVESAAPQTDAAPVTPPAADADLSTRIAGLVEQAKKGDAGFASAIAAADRRIAAASGAAAGSEPWIDAQQALSGIETARGDSISALATMDSLLVERLDAIAAGKAQGGETELRAAQSEIGAIVDRQNARLDALKGALSPG